MAIRLGEGRFPLPRTGGAPGRAGSSVGACRGRVKRCPDPGSNTRMTDVRMPFASLRRSPGFTSIAVFTLALGIGATTAIYSVVDAILLQPLPFLNSDRLVRIVENVPSVFPGRPPVQRGVTFQEFWDWRDAQSQLCQMRSPSRTVKPTCARRDGVARLWGDAVSTNTLRSARGGAPSWAGHSRRATRRTRTWSFSASRRGGGVSAAIRPWSARASNSAPTSTRAARSTAILLGS